MTQARTQTKPSASLADSRLAIVLLSRSAAYAGGLTELSELAAQLEASLAAAQTPVLRVQPAYVDRAQPALPEALDLCANAEQILILPVMVPDEPSLRRWLHKLIMRWRARRQAGGHCPRLVFGQPLLQLPALAELLAASIPCALHQPDVPELLGDEAWEQDPKAWSSVPSHRHHVLWCAGPRCAAKGSVALWPALARTVHETPGLKNQVQLLQTNCQYPCNHGPLMIVYPDGVWYGPMNANNIAPILKAHVLYGQISPDCHVHGSGPLKQP